MEKRPCETYPTMVAKNTLCRGKNATVGVQAHQQRYLNKHHGSTVRPITSSKPTNPWKNNGENTPNKPTGNTRQARAHDRAETVIWNLDGWAAFVEVRKENEEEGFRIASE